VNKQANIISNISNAATEEDFNKWAIAKAQKEQDELIRWFRAHNDAAVLAVPTLPALERRLSTARTAQEMLDALRALLAARDAVIAAQPAHDAVQAQASMPLRFGTHPLGHAEET